MPLRRLYTEAQRREVLAWIENNEAETVYTASRHFKIPKKTIYNWKVQDERRKAPAPTPDEDNAALAIQLKGILGLD